MLITIHNQAIYQITIYKNQRIATLKNLLYTPHITKYMKEAQTNQTVKAWCNIDLQYQKKSDTFKQDAKQLEIEMSRILDTYNINEDEKEK